MVRNSSCVRQESSIFISVDHYFTPTPSAKEQISQTLQAIVQWDNSVPRIPVAPTEDGIVERTIRLARALSDGVQLISALMHTRRNTVTVDMKLYKRHHERAVPTPKL